MINVLDYGAVGDGATDDTSAIISANTAAVTGEIIYFPIGCVCKTTSNITFTHQVYIDHEAGLDVVSGDIDFNGFALIADKNQKIFDLGTNSDIFNLPEAYLAWFTNNIGTTTAINTEFQKALNSLQYNKKLILPDKFITLDGTTALSVSKGQKIIGQGGSNTEVRFSTQAINGVKLETTSNPELSGISFKAKGWASNERPTSGKVIHVDTSRANIKDIVIKGAYDGIYSTDNSLVLDNIRIYDAINTGVWINGAIDIHLSKFEIAAVADIFDVDDTTGFVVGNEIEGLVSGAKATIIEIVNSNCMRVKINNIDFTTLETLQKVGTSTQCALIVQTKPHNLGGIRLQNKVEAFSAASGDVMGGKYSMTTAATVYAQGSRPFANRFVNVFFDSSQNGVLIDKSADLTFTNGWFANRANNGCRVLNSDGITFNSCSFVNNAKNGLVIESTSNDVQVIGGRCINNNKLLTGGDGILVKANTENFSIVGIRSGIDLGFTGTQDFGIRVQNGTSDNYIITNNTLLGNTTSSLYDGGASATNKIVNNNVV